MWHYKSIKMTWADTRYPTQCPLRKTFFYLYLRLQQQQQKIGGAIYMHLNRLDDLWCLFQFCEIIPVCNYIYIIWENKVHVENCILLLRVDLLDFPIQWQAGCPVVGTICCEHKRNFAIPLQIMEPTVLMIAHLPIRIEGTGETSRDL